MSTPSTPPAEEPKDTTGAEEPAATPPTAELYVPAAAGMPADANDTAELLIPPGTEGSAPPAPGTEPAWVELLRKPTLGQAVVIVTGVLVFIWGFLPWYERGGISANAWSTITIPGLVMTATWVPLLSLAIVVFMSIKVFGDGFPDTVLKFTWAQLAMVVGLFDVLITLGYLVANVNLGSYGRLSIGAGLILSFITSLVLLAGAVFDHLGMDTETLSRFRQQGEAS